MRILIASFLIIILIGCSKFEKLNENIYQIQSAHIKVSPFDDAKGMSARLANQKKFRAIKLRRLIDLDYLNRLEKQDTIFMTEEFNHECINCWSDRMHVLTNNKLVNIQTIWGNGKSEKTTYKVDTIKFSLDSLNWNYQSDYGTLLEIKKKDLLGIDWSKNLLEKGANSCFDGDHTIVTAIYPNGDIKSIYVRCWIPEIRRQTNKKN